MKYLSFRPRIGDELQRRTGKINEDKFNELIDEIKTTCESKNYPFPSLFENHNLLKEYL